MVTFGSLFAGIGGFDLGFERAGLICKWQVEIELSCQKVLTKHWPGVERYADVKEAGKHNLAAVDIICGGFPCQDLSVAGKRKGMAGEQSGLWFEFHRVIEEIKPRWVVVENVPGLLSSKGGADFAIILSGLVGLGYGVCWRVFDAQYFGLAQRRRRVFVVASLGSGRAAEVLFEREGSAWDIAPSRETGTRVAGTIAECFAGGSDQWAPYNEADNLIANTLGSHHGQNDLDSMGAYIPEIARPLANSQTNDHYDESQQTYIIEQNNMASTPDMISLRSNPAQPVIAFMPGQGAKAGSIAASEETFPTLKAAESGNRVPAVMVRSTGAGWYTEDDKGSVRAESGGTTFDILSQGVGVRRLTPTECARLQGFPDDWCAGMSNSAQYRMYGNAVAVPCVEWIGKQLMQAIQQEQLC